ncbi:MAG: DNA topoisomerase IB [Sphingomicrobium sp.]|nr:DNA topoisomerase IB [Sphingomonadales bacterium]
MLRHSNDSIPGIKREKAKIGWAYYNPQGDRITDREEIDRLNAIGLPPAYANAWFCPWPNGHIQATGTDARGRKQYRYHTDFRAKADASKYEGTLDFGNRLPRLRRKVAADLRKRSLSRNTVLAAVVRLLDTQFLRIGNSQYARKNKSFGATTLRSRHLRKEGRKLKMRFTGKHGIVHELTISDKSLGRIVSRCQDLPGQALFQYVNGDGEPHGITSADVNDYIREAMGGDFTAKHFRTWGASAIAFEQLLAHTPGERIMVQTVLEPVAAALGNTPAISRKSYVHPAILDAIKNNSRDPLEGMSSWRKRRGLSDAEAALLAFLKPRPKRRRKLAANDGPAAEAA